MLDVFRERMNAVGGRPVWIALASHNQGIGKGKMFRYRLGYTETGNNKNLNNLMNKISIILLASSLALATQAQLIDPLTGSLSGYTTTLVLDNSHGAGSGVSFTDSSSGLQANFTGTVADPEQAFFLAPAASFGTVFAVGDVLSVNVAMTPATPASSSVNLDFGLAVASTVTPTAAGSGNSYDARKTFDWAEISVRPSQTVVRGGWETNSAAGVTQVTTPNLAAAANTVSQLYIQWNSANVFTLGYVDTSSVSHNVFTATFTDGAPIGTAIGFYSDMRDIGGTTLGDFTNLSIQPIPEPTTLALCGFGGFLGLAGWLRRKK